MVARLQQDDWSAVTYSSRALPKRHETSSGDFHDRAAGVFALADGATGSQWGAEWARELVTHAILGMPFEPAAFGAWLEQRRAAFRKQLASRPRAMAWYARPLDGELGATTLLVAHVEPLPGGDVRWRARAVGDSCLFHLRGAELVKAFPLRHSAEFGMNPEALFSRTGVGDGEMIEEGGTLLPGDTLLLATDAVAKWLLLRDEEKDPRWEQACRLAKGSIEAEFRAWADEERASGRMEDDDVTLVVIQVSVEGSAPPERLSRPAQRKRGEPVPTVAPPPPAKRDEGNPDPSSAAPGPEPPGVVPSEKPAVHPPGAAPEPGEDRSAAPPIPVSPPLHGVVPLRAPGCARDAFAGSRTRRIVSRFICSILLPFMVAAFTAWWVARGTQEGGETMAVTGGVQASGCPAAEAPPAAAGMAALAASTASPAAGTAFTAAPSSAMPPPGQALVDVWVLVEGKPGQTQIRVREGTVAYDEHRNGNPDRPRGTIAERLECARGTKEIELRPGGGGRPGCVLRSDTTYPRKDPKRLFQIRIPVGVLQP